MKQRLARLKTDFRKRIKWGASILALALAATVPAISWGADEEPASNYVDIEFPASVVPPYGERRPSGGFTFGLQYEPVTLSKYTTAINGTTQSYADLYGSHAIQVPSINLGYKVNLPLIGIEASVTYGQGTVTDTQSGSNMSLLATKKGGRLIAVLDGILNENYIVPYGGVQYISWDATETNNTTNVSASGTASYAMGVIAGAYINVDWVEPRAALRSYNEGVTTTYLDVFMAQYSSTNNPNEPDFSSSMNWGAGLRVEF